ncbi:MAG: glycosyltransferase family 117 protein, partial [Gemmatimonadales bacterium]
MGSATPRLPALAVGAVVLAGYALTLAPTVTFWDAGELVAAARTLGIPHPPGTPLFVLLAHAWALLVPVGEYAVRTNLLSATASAAAAAIWFLVAHDVTRRFAHGLHQSTGRVVRLGGAAAAALAGAFTFTNWQNSNETEVYSVAMLTIAAVVWLALRWRESRSPRLLLLAVYLLALSVGNHLLALLAGPALIVFLATVLRTEPSGDPARRRAEWAQAVVVAGAWALLLGTGLGSRTLFVLGVAAFTVALGLASWRGELGFGMLVLLLAAAGVSTYAFLYIRSGQHPIINEAAPATWDALLDVIRRAQYPVRTPLDDPTVAHGPDNPGRSLRLIGFQLLNYVQYFDWQWARSLEGFARVVMTMVAVWLGLRGLYAQRRADPAGFRFLFVLFLATGLGLVAYMNFKPGFSLGLELWPAGEDHEVRERDYFFVASFVIWGLWVGIGLADLARGIGRRAAGPVPGRPLLAGLTLGIALLPAALNAPAATRRGTPDAHLAADFAYDLLNTVPPYGILFTYGDNDTFPLWWAQEVEGIRQDVAVVCIALANTPWYPRQLREHPVRSFAAAEAPEVWRTGPAAPPPGPLHTMSDEEISGIVAQRIERPLTVDFGAFRHTYPAGTVFYPSDIVAIRIIQHNLDRRPIVWSVTAGREYAGLARYVVQQGLGLRVQTASPDTASPSLHARPGWPPLDVPLTRILVDSVYRYADLETAATARRRGSVDPTAAGIAGTLAFPMSRLAAAEADRGDTAAASRLLERAARIAPAPPLTAA